MNINFQRSLPVLYDVDVFVAGGGPSGVSAAVAAARHGRSVYLAEGHSCFGGMGTAAMLPVFCQFSDGINFLAGGIGREVYDLAKPIGDPASFTHIMVEQLKRTYDDLMVKSGAAFTFETRLIAVETEGRKVTHAICSGKRGPDPLPVSAPVLMRELGNSPRGVSEGGA